MLFARRNQAGVEPLPEQLGHFSPAAGPGLEPPPAGAAGRGAAGALEREFFMPVPLQAGHFFGGLLSIPMSADFRG